MTEFYYWAGIVATFGAFCGATMCLLYAKRPRPTIGGRAYWALWSAVHIGIAVACAGYLVEATLQHPDTHWYTVLIRACLAVLLLAPWDKRSTNK